MDIMTHAETRKSRVDAPQAAIGTTDGGGAALDAARSAFSGVSHSGLPPDGLPTRTRDADACRDRCGLPLPARGVRLREYLATEEPPSIVPRFDRVPYPFPMSFALVPLGTPRGRRIGPHVLNAALRIL